jgi:hypothetical protein
MDGVSLAWSLTVSLRLGKQAVVSRVPLPNCRRGVMRSAAMGNLENDGHPPPWQEAVGQRGQPGRSLRADCPNPSRPNSRVQSRKHGAFQKDAVQPFR